MYDVEKCGNYMNEEEPEYAQYLDEINDELHQLLMVRYKLIFSSVIDQLYELRDLRKETEFKFLVYGEEDDACIDYMFKSIRNLKTLVQSYDNVYKKNPVAIHELRKWVAEVNL